MNGNRKRYKKTATSFPQGFTLMEIIVVLGIFSVLTVVIVNVFLLSLRSQRQAALRQETLANVRYVVETMARKIRTSEINYEYAYDGEAGIHGYEQELFLRDQDGNDYIFYLQNGVAWLSVNGQDSALTNLDDVTVVNLRFYIDPITNPFAKERCNDFLKPAANGCLNNTIACTIPTPDEPPPAPGSEIFKTGFCICNPNGDPQSWCDTQYCDDAAWGGADDDLGLCLPFNIQPRVTVALTIESSGIRPEDIKRISVQTTASSRVYKR